MGERSKEYVLLTQVTVKHATEKALLVQVEGHDDEVWVPRSLMDEDSEATEPGDVGALGVEAWFAEREGLT